MFSVKDKRLKYKLMLIYALMFILPAMFFLYVIITYMFPRFPIVAPITSPEMLTLTIGIAAVLLMSIGAFLLMSRSIKAIGQVTRDAESFMGELHGTEGQLTDTDDEVEKMSHYVTGMIIEIRGKMIEVNRATQELTEVNKKLAQQAIRDGLTNLFNQSYVKGRLDKEFLRAREFKRPLSTLMLDIDNFKGYNDSYGHLAGDHTLKSVGKIIRENIRHIDIPARYGGEEFLIILPETNHQDTQQIAERIRQDIARRFFPTRDHQSSTHITVSIGIGEITEEVANAKELIALADKMLYEAKNNGKNQVCG